MGPRPGEPYSTGCKAVHGRGTRVFIAVAPEPIRAAGIYSNEENIELVRKSPEPGQAGRGHPPVRAINNGADYNYRQHRNSDFFPRQIGNAKGRALIRGFLIQPQLFNYLHRSSGAPAVLFSLCCPLALLCR